MTKSSNDKFVPLMQDLQAFAFSQQGSMSILRSLGYGLLLLALFDIVEMFVPPNFMNPAWEFQTFGALVERVPMCVNRFSVGIFWRNEFAFQMGIPYIKVIILVNVVICIIVFLLIPLGVGNTLRLNNQSAAQISTLSKQQISQAEQVEKQLNQATPQQIDNFLKSQGRSLEGKNPEELKTQVLSKVSQAKKQIKTQAEATQSLRGLSLIKSSVKWNLGALVAGSLFISIWKEPAGQEIDTVSSRRFDGYFKHKA